MELSPEKEAFLDDLIEAFRNGKRLSDLPDDIDSSPYDMQVEVLCKDGQSRKAALARLLPYLEEQCAYGVEIDLNSSSPDLTRIGNMQMHKLLPIQSRMRGVTLNDDGSVRDYLDPRGWLSNIRDGSHGQVMVEIPTFYWKFVTLADKLQVWLSELPIPGYWRFRHAYVSAYEATVDRSTETLASVVNTTAQFRGGSNNATLDGTAKTQIGTPATSISRTNFRAKARKRNDNASAEWNCYLYEIHKALYWLFVVEYATLNSQKEFNAQKTSEGFRQGGLGAGVTTLDGGKWNTFNGYYPFIPCGYTDELGNATGVKAFTMPDEYNPGVETVVSVPRYRGVENPFGHIWKWADGINIQVNPKNDDPGKDVTRVFTCVDPSLFTDADYNGYSHVGNEARNDGYVKALIFGETGEIMPAVCIGAGTTTYYCDYHYGAVPASGNAVLRGLLLGGRAYHGASAGFVFAASYGVPSSPNAHIGSRLCFLPKSE